MPEPTETISESDERRARQVEFLSPPSRDDANVALQRELLRPVVMPLIQEAVRAETERPFRELNQTLQQLVHGLSQRNSLPLVFEDVDFDVLLRRVDEKPSKQAFDAFVRQNRSTLIIGEFLLFREGAAEPILRSMNEQDIIQRTCGDGYDTTIDYYYDRVREHIQ